MQPNRIPLWRLAVAATLIGLPAQADQGALVANTAIDGPVLRFDWPALEIGTASYEEGPTGVTVIRFAKRAAVAVDVRGGAPGTVNTDALRLGYGSAYTDAIVFAGGSSYGEEAITAVGTGLKDDGISSGSWQGLAFVPGAVIYDFGGRRLNEIYPDKRLAQAALRARQPGVFPLGAQGAGRMAMQGGYFRCDAHSGQGGAFRQIGPTKIAAFTVVNALGAVTDRDGRLVNCNRAKSWGDLKQTSELLRHLPESLNADWQAAEADRGTGTTRNTTISLIVTNQKLEPWALQRLAVQVHTSMARAIQPFSTQSDGDTLFAASTQEVENKALGPITLGAIASETMWDAVLASVPASETAALPAKPVSVSAATLASYAGTYRFGPPAALGAPPPGGEYSGIGLDIAVEGALLKALGPIEGGPAAKAGVQAGDIITHLNDEATRGITLDQALEKLRGPVNSQVRLRVTRQGHEAAIDIAITRQMIRLPMPALRVSVAGDTLQIAANRQIFEFENGRPRTVVALSDTVFVVDGRYRNRIAFMRDGNGKVTGVVLNPGRWAQAGTRIE